MENPIKNFKSGLFIIVIILGFSASSAHAYFDPNMGALATQLLASVGITVSLGLVTFREKIMSVFKKSSASVVEPHRSSAQKKKKKSPARAA